MAVARQPKVFCIGMIRTGTSSLAQALDNLGYRHLAFSRPLLAQWHYYRDPASLQRFARAYDSFSDWPWIGLYKEMDKAFPNSKFILTLRAFDDVWLDSLKRHARNLNPVNNVRPWTFGFEKVDGNEEALLDHYRRHNEAVQQYFNDRENDFRQLCWEEGDGWEELCGFLGKEVPEGVEFPHLNRGRGNFEF